MAGGGKAVQTPPRGPLARKARVSLSLNGPEGLVHRQAEARRACDRTVVAILLALSVVGPSAGVASLAVVAGVALFLAFNSLVRVRRAELTLQYGRTFRTAIALASVFVIATLVNSPISDAGGQLILWAPLVCAASVFENGSDRILHKFAWALGVVAVVQAAVAALQYLFSWPTWGGLLGSGLGPVVGVNNVLPDLDGRVIGTLAHPIVLGTVAAVAIALAFTKEFTDRRWWRVACVTAGVLALCLSGTRSALIVLTVALIVQIFRDRSVLSGILGRFAVALLIVLAIVSVNWRELRLISSLEGSLSLLNRLGSWRVLASVFEKSPADLFLGLGARANETLAQGGYLAAGNFTYAIDNTFVSTILSGGFVALALILYLTGCALMNPHPIASCLGLVSVGMMLSFDIVFWPIPTLVLLIASSRMVVPMVPLSGRTPPPEDEPSVLGQTNFRGREMT